MEKNEETAPSVGHEEEMQVCALCGGSALEQVLMTLWGQKSRHIVTLWGLTCNLGAKSAKRRTKSLVMVWLNLAIINVKISLQG